MNQHAIDLLLVLARIKEYELRGERDSGLQELRWQLKRAIAVLEHNEESNT